VADVTMWSIEGCPHCVNARALLAEKGVAYMYHDITPMEKDELNAKMMELTGGVSKTVPQIWIDGDYIGGNAELQALNEAGGLDEKLGL